MVCCGNIGSNMSLVSRPIIPLRRGVKEEQHLMTVMMTDKAPLLRKLQHIKIHSPRRMAISRVGRWGHGASLRE